MKSNNWTSSFPSDDALVCLCWVSIRQFPTWPLQSLGLCVYVFLLHSTVQLEGPPGHQTQERDGARLHSTEQGLCGLRTDYSSGADAVQSCPRHPQERHQDRDVQTFLPSRHRLWHPDKVCGAYITLILYMQHAQSAWAILEHYNAENREKEREKQDIHA